MVSCLNDSTATTRRLSSDMSINSQVLEELLNKSANGILMLDEEGIIQYANAYTYQLFEYKQPALVGRHIDTLIPEQFSTQHRHTLKMFCAESSSQHTDEGRHLPAIKASGEHFHVCMHLAPSEDTKHFIATVIETTENKKRENDLKAQSAHLKTLNQQLLQFTKETTNALLTTDDDFRISWANPAFERLTGYKTADVQFERPLLLVGRKTSLFELRKLQNAVDSNVQYSGELLLYRKNEVPFWSMINIQPYQVESRLQGFLILFTDITEQKNLESKLIESNHLQKAILNSAPIILMSTSAQGVISTFNQYASELLDCNQIDVVERRTPLAFFSDSGRVSLCHSLGLDSNINDSLIIKRLNEFCSERSMRIEVDFISFSERTYTMELSISAVESRTLDSLGLLWLGRDVSAQRIAEAENQRSTKLLETTGKMAKLGGWELELSTNSLFWSDEVYQIHEIPIGSEVKVKDAINFYTPEAQPVISAAVENAIAAGEAWDEQLQLITAKGTTIWVRAVGYAEYENGTAKRLRGAFQDITELKNVEQAAVAASAAKSDFLANISHEIRTPLNGIIGLNELMAKSSLSTQQSEYVGMIAHSSSNLLRIVNDILDFAKIEAGKMALQSSQCNVLKLVHQVVETYAAQTEDNPELILAVDCDDQLSEPIYIDQGRLQQILNNLVSNAIKFTPQGSITVTACIQQDNHVMFEVIDTGIGIPAEKQQSLFEKFTQVDMSATRQKGGTGLGLAICYQLVHLMGGEIGLNSDLNRGSMFWFSIPYQKLSVEKSQSTSNPQVSVKKERSILIVCSDPDLELDWCEATLTSDLYEFSVTTVETAPQAIKSMRERCPDVVVVYSNLTGMQGVEFVKFLRDQEVFSNVKLIGIDESQSPHAEALYQNIGIDSYFPKSASIIDIMESIHLLLNDKVDPTSHSSSAVSSPLVLLVEDNDINQIVAKDMLESLGCKVSLANNGQMAVDMIKQRSNRFDIIFMDCQMPILDGYAAARKIRQLPAEMAQSIPIIALTANVMAADRQLCIDAGMNEHIGKPVNIDTFKNILAQWCR